MKLLEKNERLPRITLRELEQKIRGQSQSPKKGLHKTNEKEMIYHKSQLKDLKILSPFYPRQSKRKQKCECQYHRFKRSFQQSKTHPSHKAQIDQCQERVRHQKDEQQSEIKHYENIYKKQQRSMQSTARFLMPLNDRIIKHTRFDKDKHAVSNNNTRRSEIITTQNMLKMGEQQNEITQIQKLALKHKKTVSNTINFLDAINEEYICLINKRLQNNEYKDKYLKNLFGFIRVKANIDKQYIWQSRAYIINNLNILLNHFKMDKLIQYQQLREEDLQKITSIIKCHSGKTPIILRDLKKVVRQMLTLLQQLKKQRIQQENIENKNFSDNSKTNNIVNLSDRNQKIQNQIGTNALIKLDQNEQQKNETNKSTNSISGERDLPKMVSIANLVYNKPEINECEQGYKQNLMTSFLQKGLDIRKSVKHLTEPLNLALQNKLTFLNSQQRQKTSDKINQSQRKRKSQHKTQKSQITSQMGRSVRMSDLGIVNQNEKDHKFSKKLKKTKHKKVQFPKINAEPQLDEKYLQIKYEPFCTKNTFRKMIGEVERRDLSDNEKALVIYSHLNVQHFVEDRNKIEILINTFNPLFHHELKQQFLNHILAVKDRRFIESLEHQLDFMLGEIKKNDLRIEDDFYQIIPEKKVQKKVVEFKQHQPQKSQKMDKIIYYEADEKIQKLRRLKKDEKLSNLNLQQTNMNEIISQKVKPTLTQSIYHSSFDKSSAHFGLLPNLKDQKQILRFMKKNYLTTFEQLADNFEEICKSLEKDESSISH